MCVCFFSLTFFCVLRTSKKPNKCVQAAVDEARRQHKLCQTNGEKKKETKTPQPTFAMRTCFILAYTGKYIFVYGICNVDDDDDDNNGMHLAANRIQMKTMLNDLDVRREYS